VKQIASSARAEGRYRGAGHAMEKLSASWH
jgi:hypothetical protein